MKTLLGLFGASTCILLLGTVGRAAPVATVAGVVTDEKGNPLDHVTVQVYGMEELHDGTWVRSMKLGEMPSYSTDKDGRFAIPFNRKDIRYDVWFDRLGFAPSFLSGVWAESGELKVAMNRGTPVTGIVTRLVKGQLEPVHGATVELSLMTWDMDYQQRVTTGPDGRYTLRASPPPKDSKWHVVFAGEGVNLDVKEGEPVQAPDFVIVIQVRENAVQPPAGGDGKPAPQP